ncbi:MAG: SurA N-terminal domain-containing protein [Sphingomonas sp.]|nr:SurA N-terminal domain-containing protein [Sphingomonas sp.]
MSKRLAISTMCAAAALLAGCHKGVPEGQVAATVNGEEVTLQELNTEIQASNIPQGMDKQVAQQQALQHIIDRKLLLDAARDKKIDKSPEFQAQKQRADELLLAQAYARQQLAAVPMPTDGDIQKFMADHPNAFANRETLQLDQLRFRPNPGDLKKLSIIRADHNLDAVAAHLAGLGIKFDRVKAGLDTGQVPTDMMKEINNLPAGEPFVLPANGILTVNVIVGRQAISSDSAQARQGAVGAWRQQQFTKLIGDQLKSMKDSAKITYQNGFAPPPEKKPGATAIGAPAGAK